MKSQRKKSNVDSDSESELKPSNTRPKMSTSNDKNMLKLKKKKNDNSSDSEPEIDSSQAHTKSKTKNNIKSKKKNDSDSESEIDSPKTHPKSKKKNNAKSNKNDSDNDDEFKNHTIKIMDQVDNFIKEGNRIKNMVAKLGKIHDVVVIRSEKEIKHAPVSEMFKPTTVPKSIAKLLKIDSDTKKLKTEITYMICEYIDHKNLKDDNDKRLIRPNKELIAALQLKKNEELTFPKLPQIINRVYNDCNDSDSD